MNDDELRAHLRAAVPEPPDASTWAAEVHQRHDRRARRARAGAVAVVVLAMIGVFVWPSLNGAGRVAVPAATPTPTPATGSVRANPDCTGTLAASKTLTPRGRKAVLRVSLCPRTDGPTFTTPTDALDEGATALFDTVAALPAERRRDPDCSAAGDRRYLVVFTLADDSRRVLEAATANACGVEPGSANARRWSGLLSALEKAWTTQRASRSQAQVAAGCVPYDRPGLFRFDISQALAGTLCVADRAGTVIGSVPLSSDLLGLLRTDIAAHSSRANNIDSLHDGPVLTLVGPWNDPLVLWSVGANQWFAFLPDGKRFRDQLFWQPGAEAAAALDALLDQMPPRNSPPPTPVPPKAFVPGPCQNLVPSSSPVQVPDRADRLRLCPTARTALSTFTPLDAVVGDDTATVLATLAGLPKASGKGPCTDELGPEFLLVAESDGRAPVVMVLQLYGCRLAGIADAPSTGADTVLTSFSEQLGRQRQLIDRPVATRAGSWCGTLDDPPTSVMSMSASEAVSAQLCRYESHDEPARRVTLDGPDLRAILADLPGRTGVYTPLPCPNARQIRGTRIALTSFYGDVLTMTQSCGSMFVFTVGTDQLQWKPSAAVVQRLAKLAAA